MQGRGVRCPLRSTLRYVKLAGPPHAFAMWCPSSNLFASHKAFETMLLELAKGTQQHGMRTKSNESFHQALCVSSVQACVSGVANHSRAAPCRIRSCQRAVHRPLRKLRPSPGRAPEHPHIPSTAQPLKTPRGQVPPEPGASAPCWPLESCMLRIQLRVACVCTFQHPAAGCVSEAACLGVFACAADEVHPCQMPAPKN